MVLIFISECLPRLLKLKKVPFWWFHASNAILVPEKCLFCDICSEMNETMGYQSETTIIVIN